MLSDMKDWQRAIAGSLLLLVAACTIPNGPSSWQEEKGNSTKEILASYNASLGETVQTYQARILEKKVTAGEITQEEIDKFLNGDEPPTRAKWLFD
jgi:hypothetical protein